MCINFLVIKSRFASFSAEWFRKVCSSPFSLGRLNKKKWEGERLRPLPNNVNIVPIGGTSAHFVIIASPIPRKEKKKKKDSAQYFTRSCLLVITFLWTSSVLSPHIIIAAKRKQRAQRAELNKEEEEEWKKEKRTLSRMRLFLPLSLSSIFISILRFSQDLHFLVLNRLGFKSK